MKFAVVEYDSKTHHIWRHTDEHPNFLADPIKEIDPTSFACYVSALRGEHIPLKLLALGGGASQNGTFARRLVKKLTGVWPPYDLSYLRQFDVILAVHQLSEAQELVSFLKRLRQQAPRTVILGVPTQPYGILLNAFTADSGQQDIFVEFMNACDVFLSIVKETVPWYQALTSTPVVYMPQPYPVEFAMQSAQPRLAKEATILIAGVTQRDNIKQGQIVAREIQKIMPQYRIVVPKVADLPYDFSNLKGAAYDVLPFENWQDHLKTLSRVSLVINTDATKTRGRLQADCAAVGTVAIGSNSDAQADLFPAFVAAEHTTVADMVAWGRTLLEDPAYYDVTTAQAKARLAEYNYAKSATRLEGAVAKIQTRKRFLVRHLGNMGDFIFLVPPVLVALKKHHPGCQLTVVTAWGFKDRRGRWGKRAQDGANISLAMNDPNIDTLVHWHDTALALDGGICDEAGRNIPTWNREYYDMQKASGAYAGVYELDFGIKPEANPLTEIYKMLDLPNEDFSEYRIYLSATDLEVARAVMARAPHPRIALLESLAGTTTRNWDPGKAAALEKAIFEHFKVKPYWFGAQYVPEYLGRRLTLRENIATLALADVAVGVLSGPLHFAAAVGVPTLTLNCDQPLHRAIPAYFLNRYITDANKKHRTLLGPSSANSEQLKNTHVPATLTLAEQKQQHYRGWQDPGRQATKSCLAVITVDEIITALADMLGPRE